MTDQEIRLKFGEMNAGEMRLARALVEWHEREIVKHKDALTEARQIAESFFTYINPETHNSIVSEKAAEIGALKAERDELDKDLSALLSVLDAHDVTEGVETARYWKQSIKRLMDERDKAQAVVVNEPPKSEKQPDLSGESEKQTEPAWIPHDGSPCPLKDKEVEMWECRLNGGAYDYKTITPPSASDWSKKPDNGFSPIIAYRVLKWKPGFGPGPDPYAGLKAAHAAGKIIQMKLKNDPDDTWDDIPDPEWGGDPDEYRIKPEPAQSTMSIGWTPAVGDVVSSIPEMALGGQMYWRDLALQLARVWWKCYKIGASLQHGDLDKDIAFSIVCERHGGRVFHGDTPENAWHKAEEWLLSPDRENFLTQAQP